MAPERLSRLQRRILAWLVQEEVRTPGGHTEALDLTAAGRQVAARLAGSCE